MTQPVLTDRQHLIRARARVRSNALFLHDEAIAELQDRLSLVNRTFQRMVIVTGHPEPWASAFPHARIISDDETLALEPQSCDLIVHAMALHWANDPVGQMIQCRRALVNDGFFIAMFFGAGTLTELRAALAQAEAQVVGGLSPRVAPMGEIRDLGGLLQRAGFALPVADALPLTLSYESPWSLMRELRAMGEANSMTARLRHPTRRAVFEKMADIYQQNFSDPSGRIFASIEMIWLAGWAPDESQQKPLRPGSAAARLADALQTQEVPLKD